MKGRGSAYLFGSLGVDAHELIQFSAGYEMIDFYHGSIRLHHCLSLRKKQTVLIYKMSVELHKTVLRLEKYSGLPVVLKKMGMPFVPCNLRSMQFANIKFAILGL